MKKVLVVTSRNIITTCGELRLIKGRAIILEKEYGIKTDFVAYRVRKSKTDRFEKLNGPLKLLRNPFDKVKLIKLIKRLISLDNYMCVILSGPLVYFLIPIIRKINSEIKIILDLHGSIEEFREFKSSSFFKQLIMELLYFYTRQLEKKYIGESDGILVVSYPLAHMAVDDAKEKKLKTFIIPCAVESRISYSQYMEYRKKYRQKYNIDNNTKVFIYSGGNSPWQCVGESIRLFQRIKASYSDCKMLLFSGNRELIDEYRNDNDIIVDSLQPEIVTAALCAGDYGLMLRGDFVTNNVAFPNKFLEYVISGLRVIATPYIYDVRNFIEKYDIGEIVELNDSGEKIIKKINEEYDMESHFRRRDKLLEQCGFKNTLRPFVEYIEDTKTQ